MEDVEVWCEKYRPSEIDNVLLPEKTKKAFKNLIKTGKLPNMLFSGLPGTGKTTLAMVLVNELGVSNSLYINASEENGIDTIRTKVNDFCSRMALDDNIKILILDEADGISFAGQQALRNTIEKYKSTRFIFTCNHPEKIRPALKSRLKEVVFRKVDVKDIKKMVGCILRAEEIDFSDVEQKKAMLKLIDKFYPDMRKIINHLEYFCSSGKLEIDLDEVVADDTYETVVELIGNGKLLTLWEVMRNNKLDYEGIIKRIFHDTLDGKDIFGEELSNSVKSEIVVQCGTFTRYSAEVVDREMNFMEFAVEIMRVV